MATDKLILKDEIECCQYIVSVLEDCKFNATYVTKLVKSLTDVEEKYFQFSSIQIDDAIIMVDLLQKKIYNLEEENKRLRKIEKRGWFSRIFG